MVLLEKGKSILTFILVIVLSSCGGSDEPSPVEDDSKDREAILVHWADNIIKPSYANFELQTGYDGEQSRGFHGFSERILPFWNFAVRGLLHIRNGRKLNSLNLALPINTHFAIFSTSIQRTLVALQQTSMILRSILIYQLRTQGRDFLRLII